MVQQRYPRYPHLDDAIVDRDEAWEYFRLKVQTLFDGPVAMWERLDVTLV